MADTPDEDSFGHNEEEVVVSDFIDLERERWKRAQRRHPPPYLDPEEIRKAADRLDEIADRIARASIDQVGSIDPVAYELTAFARAVRRIVDNNHEPEEVV